MSHEGIAHPVVMDRLLEDMSSLADLAANAPAESFAGESAWKTLCRLRDELDHLAAHAELHRPAEH